MINQPDTFGLGIYDNNGNLGVFCDLDSNAHDSTGGLLIEWVSSGEYIAWRNTRIEVRESYSVEWNLSVLAWIEILDPGNLVAPR
jgi:hypothetical protein